MFPAASDAFMMRNCVTRSQVAPGPDTALLEPDNVRRCVTSAARATVREGVHTDGDMVVSNAETVVLQRLVGSGDRQDDGTS